MSRLIVKSGKSAEVFVNNSVILSNNNSKNGINVICFNKTLTSKLIWNFNLNTKNNMKTTVQFLKTLNK